MNRILFRTWPVEHKAVSSVLRYARPRFHRLFRPSWLAPDEQHAFRCLPMNTTTTQFLRSDPAMCTSPGRTYARVGVRDPARMYVRGRIFWRVAVCTCTQFRRDSLNCYVGGSTMTCAATYSTTVHRCKATDRPVCTYTFVTRMTTLCTLRLGGSRLSGTSLHAKM